MGSESDSCKSSRQGNGFCHSNNREDFVVFIGEVDAAQCSKVGGKGANLARMLDADACGLNIPDAACVTFKAFNYFMVENSLFDGIWQKIGNLRSTDLADLEEEAAAVRQRVLGGRIPDPVADAISAAYERLVGDQPGALVAVRSSANVEDSLDSSYAGQFDTYLCVAGLEELLEKVRACWASLWTSRAIAYRIRNGVDESRISIGVVIQRMVMAEAAGVMFTCSPTDANLLMIDSNYGLGETVVSGMSASDNFLVGRDDLTLVDRKVSEKAQCITFDEDAGQGTVTATIDEGRRDRQSLTDSQICHLAELGLSIERVFGAPQDIEWALEGSTFHILQSRPITTYAAQAAKDAVIKEEIEALQAIAGGRDVVWSDHDCTDIIFRLTPASWEMTRTFISNKGSLGPSLRRLGFYPNHELDNGLFDLVAGRRYNNHYRLTQIHYPFLPFKIDLEELRSKAAKGLPVGASLDLRSAGLKFWLKSPYYLALILLGAMKHARLFWIYRQRFDSRIVPEHERYLEAMKAVDLQSLSTADLIAQLRRWWNEFLKNDDILIADMVAITGFAVLSTLMAKLMPEDPHVTMRLLQGLEINHTTACNIQMQKVAIGEASLEDFLERFGHRSCDEYELSLPCWSEDPSFIEQMLENLGAGLTRSAESDLDAQRKSREEAQKHVEARLRTRWYGRWIPGWMYRRIIERAQRTWPLRENYKHYLLQKAAFVRKAMLVLGERYGIGDGIFYLESHEIDSFDPESMIPVIQKRRQRRKVALSIEIPGVVFSDDLEAIGRPEVVSVDASCELTGLPASSGVAIGTARIVKSWDDSAKFKADDILVIPSDNPSLTPIFMLAKGVVVNEGSMLGHGAVLSREFGLPAVINVKKATQIIRDGQKICVDGNRGVVSILDDDDDNDAENDAKTDEGSDESGVVEAESIESTVGDRDHDVRAHDVGAHELRVDAVITSGGRSSRMGQPKALLTYKEDNFLNTLVRKFKAVPVRDVMVFLAHESEAIAREISPDLGDVKIRQEPGGIHASIASAFDELAGAQDGPDAVFLTTVDAPGIEIETLRKMLHSCKIEGKQFVVPSFDGQLGLPFLVARSFFSDFREFSKHYDEKFDDAKMRGYWKEFLEDNAEKVLVWRADDPTVVQNINTPDDYRKLQTQLGNE